MKKILLLFACSGVILATAQNNVNINQTKHNNKKLTVREMALQKNPILKRQQERLNRSKVNHPPQTASICSSNYSFSVDSLNQVTFTDVSYSDSTIISWMWDFGDSTNSTLQNPIHQYAHSGTYSVCLTINSIGCNDVYCYNISVNDYSNSCTPNFNFVVDSLNNNIVNFTDQSSAGMGNIISWAWDFGDTTTATTQNPSHTFSQVGTYSVCLTITTDTGCTSSFCQQVSNLGNSTLVVDTISNLTQALTSMLFGSCVTVSNLTYTGAPSAIGYFSDNSASIDSSFTYGIIMTTGSVFNAKGPNNSPSMGTNNGLPGDSTLNSLIPGYTTYDASILEFDFTSVSDTLIASKIVFASEEYPEFVGTNYNDVFGFFISGPGITGVKNLALVPGTNDPISVNSVNQHLDSTYYVDNTNGTTWQYDGHTKVIALKQAITPGQTYHFKIAIADAGDGIYDSGVLIKAGSFNGNTQLPLAHFSSVVDSSLTVHFNNTSTNATVYVWNFGDGVTDTAANPIHTYAAPGTYTVVLLASNICYSDTTSHIITILPNGINSINATNSMKIIPTMDNGIYNAIVQSSVNEKIEVRVYNISGQLISSNSYTNKIGQNSYPLNLSEKAQGIYTVQIIGNKELFVSKLIR